MKIRFEKITAILVLLILFSITLMSCRTTHSSCPAYGGESSRYKIERLYTK